MKFIEPYIGILKAIAFLAVVLGLLWVGMRIERAGWVEKEKKAVEKALDGERELRAVSDGWTSDYINRIAKQLEAARAKPKITLVNDCPVPAAVGGMLNDAQRMHTDAGTGSSPGTTSQEVDSACAAELDIAKRNYAEVCVPNAEQLTEIQTRWEKTRKLISGK